MKELEELDEQGGHENCIEHPHQSHDCNSSSSLEQHVAVNDNVDDDNNDNDVPLPLVMRKIPRFFRFDNAPPEATGLALDVYARGAVLMSSLFMGPALLTLATDAATTEKACTTTSTEDDCRDENARIYGMKPSSLLSNIAIVSGLLAAFILPLFGAIVDQTPYRRQVGIWSAVFLTVIKGAETIVSSRTWFVVAMMQVGSGALYFVHTSATWAYTSELSDNHKQQTTYNAYYFVVLYVSTLIFLAEVLTVAFALHTNDVGTARISQVVTCLTSATFFGFSWKHLFRERPALRPRAADRGRNGRSCFMTVPLLLSSGLQQIRTSLTMIRRDLPSLTWLMCAITSSESATAALITIATTYMSHFLEMTANEIGVVFLAVLLMGAPGSRLGEVIGLRFDPLVSAKACTVFFLISTTTASLVLTGPDDKHLTAIFGSLWGLGLGWLHPMHSTLFITITPTGQETELMSLYLFCGQVLSWLPPLLFTVLNEVGVHMSIGLASLDVFFAMGLFCLYCMGDYNVAREQARHEHQRGNTLVSLSLSSSDDHSSLHDGAGDGVSLPPIS